jgi:cytochrome c-type biogenesis protein CcsB
MQVFIGLQTDFQYWYEQPIVYVSGDSTKNLLGKNIGTRAKMSDFYDDKGQYKLDYNMEQALLKDPKTRNVFDKNVVKTDERLNVLRMTMMGYLLKIFPVKDDPMGKWYAPSDVFTELHGSDSLYISTIMSGYVYGVRYGQRHGDWSEANMAKKLIDRYQDTAGDKDVMPSKEKISWGVFYNDVNIFKHITNFYVVVGLFLLIVQFTQIFKPKKSFKWAMRIGFYLFVILFLIHGFGLGLRWYLSGHAPWSDGYEVLIFVAMIVALAGIIFSRISKIIVGAAGILVWLLLFVSNMANMDPQIVSNLEPVLKSYWLQIHVSIITGSYAFLGLSAILGIILLFMDIFKKESNIKLMKLTAKELRYVSEMTMTIGLFMLTIGTFLGGVWANESWGRYWGWDAKETWALASVLVYTIILHFRFVPGCKSDFTFNLWSLWGYASIIMTFYGVNYYLAGMHSYATEEAVPIPTWVFVTVIVFFILSVLAWLNKRKFEKK